MNLTSCSNCGVVLDRNHLKFPYIYDEDDGVDDSKAVWDGDDWVAFVSCPVCGIGKIKEG